MSNRIDDPWGPRTPYRGLSYPLLRERSGVQWPCTTLDPDGTERLYADG